MNEDALPTTTLVLRASADDFTRASSQSQCQLQALLALAEQYGFHLDALHQTVTVTVEVTLRSAQPLP